MGRPPVAGRDLGFRGQQFPFFFRCRDVDVLPLFDEDLDDLAVRKRNVADHDLALLDGRCKDHGHTSSVAQTRGGPQQRLRQRNVAISRDAASGSSVTRTRFVRCSSNTGQWR
ncbi:MAG TPA: hypothetical protein VFV99_07760 [Kofleriaceae bacterium]|nr:hypothetical protein [Kofleriaceae bacterium]